MRRLLISFTAIATITFSLTAATFTNLEDISKYKWNPNPNTGGYAETMKKPLLGYYVGIEEGNRPLLDSFIKVAIPEQPLCDGFDDPVCQSFVISDMRQWWTNSMLAPCASNNELTKCIEAVRITYKNGEKKSLVLLKQVPGVTVKAEPRHGLEAGSTASLWVDPKDPIEDRGYILSVGGGLYREGPRANPTKTYLDYVDANVIPYKLITNMKGTRATEIFPSPATGLPAIGFGGPDACLWTDFEECGVQSEFEAGSEIELVLHLPSNLTGWIFGRMASPIISVAKISKTSPSGFPINRITVSAKPIELPLFSATVPVAKASAKLKATFANPDKSPCLTTRPACQHGWVGGSTSGSGEAALQAYDMLEGSLPENAQIKIPKWSFSTVPSEFKPKDFSACSKSSKEQFLGVVTTNATIYMGTPPKLEKGSLNYKVAALHNLPNGEEFKGSYDLVLASPFARCIYGFSSASISASVSVFSSNGEKQVATTVVSEKDGWLSLSAKNFTFSSPSIKIKLNQKKR